MPYWLQLTMMTILLQLQFLVPKSTTKRIFLRWKLSDRVTIVYCDTQLYLFPQNRRYWKQRQYNAKASPFFQMTRDPSRGRWPTIWLRRRQSRTLRRLRRVVRCRVSYSSNGWTIWSHLKIWIWKLWNHCIVAVADATVHLWSVL